MRDLIKSDFRHLQKNSRNVFLTCHHPSFFVFARSWTVTCPHLWSPHCLLHLLCRSQSSPRPPSFQRPAAPATASASGACPILPASKISWSSWESTQLTSNPTEFTWFSTSRSDCLELLCTGAYFNAPCHKITLCLIQIREMNVIEGNKTVNVKPGCHHPSFILLFFVLSAGSTLWWCFHPNEVIRQGLYSRPEVP